MWSVYGMENKSIKTEVFVKEKVYNNSAEQPIDIDFTLPDYYPPVNKILKCRAVPRISSKGISGSNLNVDGIVTVTVIYCDESGKISSYEYQYPFQKIFECDFDAQDTVFNALTRCEYINCRAVTNRKIDIHGACGIYVYLIKCKGNDVISDIDEPDIELLRGEVPATSPMGRAEKYLMLDEEIDLGENQQPVNSVIRYDAGAVIKETKILSGKAVVKGEVIVTALCSTLGGALQTVRSNIPFTQRLEIEGLSDRCLVNTDAQIAYLEITIKPTDSGESSCLKADAKLLICCESSCDNDIAVVLDAYSRKYETEVIKKEVSFEKICKNINETFSCKKNIEFQNEEVSSVADIWCDVKVGSTSASNGKITVNGTVTVALIAYDGDMIPFVCEKPIDFEYSCSTDENCDIRFIPQISVNSANYTLTGGDGAEIRIELCVCGSVYRCEHIYVVTDIKSDREKELVKKDRSAMTIYFASCGEKVWDIAHHYGASVCQIKQINDIKGDSIENDRMLLVPMN